MSALRSPLLLVLASAQSLFAQDGAGRAAATITPADIARQVGVIADDSMRGRDTPSPELDLVAAYIGAEFRRFGLAPGGDDGGFIQRYEIQRSRLDTAASRLEVLGGPTLRFGADVIRWRGAVTAAGATGETLLLSGVATGPGAADGLEVAGKVVLVIPRTDGAGQPSRESERFLRALAGRGPAAIVVVVDAPDEAWPELGRGQLAEGVGVPWRREDGTAMLLVRERALAPTLVKAGVAPAAARAERGAVRVRPVPGLRFRATLAPEVLHADRAPNVVGMLRGSDPRLRDEYVVFSAHMDHVGTAGRGRCRAQGADSICNGADDDASGTVSVMELAEAFARLTPRPRRSLIFVTVSGEERGLWGSDYFAGHPPVPVERMVANLNLDMVGRNWKDTISVIGREHSDLGATLARVNAAHPELGMTAVDDLWPQENFYFRSDHYNFARRGVPILFFFNGTHEDYHRPSDHPDKIDAEKQARLTRLVFYLGLEVANAADRPRWRPESYKRIVTEGR
jgi:Peptidase family M28